MSNRSLQQAIVDLGVPRFGTNFKNKGDSPSCQFEPRYLLSDPLLLKCIGKRLADLILKDCSDGAVIGMATSGVAWATLAGLYSQRPVLYIRKETDVTEAHSRVEGLVPESRKLILVDDLLFAGESKRIAINALQAEGFEVTDVVVIIDRQLQRKADGLSLQEQYGVRLHSLCSMDEIVRELKSRNAITSEQLFELANDYRRFSRWDLPDFAR